MIPNFNQGQAMPNPNAEPGHPEHPVHPEHPAHPEHPVTPNPPTPPTPPEPPTPPTPPGPPTPPDPPTPPEPEKPINIIVNAEDKLLPAGTKMVSYQYVVELAYGKYEPSDTTIYTVVYSHGPVENPKGSLVLDQSVKVKEGMIFNVGRSDKS